jgi:hypothetical protein
LQQVQGWIKNAFSILLIGVIPFGVSFLLFILGGEYMDLLARWAMIVGIIWLMLGVILLVVVYRKFQNIQVDLLGLFTTFATLLRRNGP